MYVQLGKRHLTAAVLCLVLLLLFACSSVLAEEKQLTVLFTSDIHSYFIVSSDNSYGTQREHGGAGRLMTLIRENTNDHTVLVDAGDFSMGTLLQTGYADQAYELRLLGRLGYLCTTFGNHEFDLGGDGAAKMLRSAMSSGEKLPMLLAPANLDLSASELTQTQQSLSDAMQEAGCQSYLLCEVNGIRIAVFGLLGNEAISNAPTSGVVWLDPIASAKKTVKTIGDQADVIICISHSGTNGDGKSGEDIDLLKAVPGIDVVISGHTHTTYYDAVTPREGTVLGSPGAYLNWLGRMDLTVLADGTVRVDDYQLIPCDENVAAEPETEAVVAGYMDAVNASYMADTGYTADQVIAHSDYDMSASYTREEMPLGTLIADSYLYACREAGYTEVSAAVVGLGTIRKSIQAGDITAAQAFEICSLGMGEDGSAGHPLVGVWLRGSDLKLLAEMDACLAPLMHSVSLSYGGLSVTFDEKRVPFDRVTGLYIRNEDGSQTAVAMNERYFTVGNMYAINMLSSIKSMTYGIISLSITDQQGNALTTTEDYYSAAIRKDGREVKEWQAFCDYLSSFEKRDGVSVIPQSYLEGTGSKTVTSGNLIERIKDPGPTTMAVIGLIALFLILIVTLILTHGRRKQRRLEKREARNFKKAERRRTKA